MRCTLTRLCISSGAIAIAVLATSCTQSPETRAKEIAAALDAPALRAWAAGIVASVGKDYTIPYDSVVFKELPAAVRSVPHAGMVGPTRISTRNGRIELMWIDSWGHGFVLAVAENEMERRATDQERVLVPGISFWPVGTGSR